MSTAEPPDESGPPDPLPVQSPPPLDAPPPTDATPAATAPSGATWSATTTGVVPAPPTVTTPDPWNPPAAKPKRKLTWLWVFLAAVVLVTALVVVAVVLFVRTTAGPMDATNDLLAQVKAENYAGAYRLSCSADRELYTIEQYTRVFVNTKDARGALKSYDVNYSNVNGDTAEVRYDLEFGRGDRERYKAVAHKENGTWRTCLFPR